ncbi:MAG: peptidase S10, partial [Candidatus Latescibacteria bacterium]|nr:peptidase S10 [bacterium]MBD3425396.1 peptidase S10 [Candidatus Latescibacterota bacterium]
MKNIIKLTAALTVLTILSPLVLSGENTRCEKDREEEFPPLEERVSVTENSVDTGSGRIEYRATAGTFILTDEKEQKAEIFYIAYRKKGVRDPAERPVTFSFNGGPGSSSVWLHLGLLGPRRVRLLEDGTAPPPPWELIDNSYSLLDVTDLVFIDPVTTGFSRAAPGEEPGQFHGVEQDIRWVGEFIRLYLSRTGRWGSPKFLIGESYGTTRAAGLSMHLQERRGIFFNGIMLISSILNWQTTNFTAGNDLPYPLFLPTYTATAWYHGMLEESYRNDLEKAVSEAEQFATGEYNTVLMLGDQVPPERYRSTALRLSELTGLSEEYIMQSNLRVRIHRFAKELLRTRRLTTGRLDSRFRGIDRDAAGEGYEYDPSYSNIYGPFSALMKDYVRRELDFRCDKPYEILTGQVHPWDFGKFRNRYVNVAESLRSAMNGNPALGVYIACGYY